MNGFGVNGNRCGHDDLKNLAINGAVQHLLPISIINQLKKDNMTSIANSFSALTASLKPWADLAKSHTEAQVAHVKAVSAALANGVNQESLTKLIELTHEATAQHLATATSAFRLHTTQTGEALNAQMSKAGLSAKDLVKRVQAEVATAHEAIVTAAGEVHADVAKAVEKVSKKVSAKKA